MKLGIIFFTILLSGAVFSQSNESMSSDTKDSTFVDLLVGGNISGSIRNHFMATVHAGEISDYWTDAISGRLKYETRRYKGFSIASRGLAIQAIAASNLKNVDPISGKTAKWENELYDISSPSKYKNLFLLEELYIQYAYKKSYLKIGKIDINEGPFFHNRDSRMSAFMYQGIWGKYKELKHWEFTFGWITGVSMRANLNWYSIHDAIGLNNNGFEPDGTKAAYHEMSATKGIGVLGASFQLNQYLTVQISDYWIHHIDNSIWAQADYKRKHAYMGIQYVYQIPLNQENLPYNNRFLQPDEHGQVISAKLGIKRKPIDISVAYLHAFATGRFLFPRELGREDFYVSQPRSWIDGFGDTDVYMARIICQPRFLKNIKLDIRGSYTKTAGYKSYEFNKYGLPSFYQLTNIFQYKCSGKLEGLDFSLLYIYKYSDIEFQKEAEKFYLSDFHHISFISKLTF